MKKTLSPGRRHAGALLILLLIIPLAAGCGRPKGTVSGKVTYQGKPLKTGFVTFTPDKGPAVNSAIDSEGNYKVENVPVGTARISVREEANASSETLSKVQNPRDPQEMMKAMRQTAVSTIPRKYNTPEESELTYTVQQGPQEHDIDLK
jgi:hypothetical protein